MNRRIVDDEESRCQVKLWTWKMYQELKMNMIAWEIQYEVNVPFPYSLGSRRKLLKF